MASKKINLLPTNLAAPSDILKIVDNIKRISVTIFIIFFIGVAIGGGLLFFAFKNENEIKTKNQELETNVKSLEQTEQKLVLIRDRIEKIKTVSGNVDAAPNIDKLNKIITSFVADITLESATVDTIKTKFSVLSKSSSSMAEFLKNIVAVADYKKISLTSFTYTPSIGYDISLQIQ